MFSIGHITGGTNAGWRTPWLGKAAPWECKCPRSNAGYINNCLECGERRPEDD